MKILEIVKNQFPFYQLQQKETIIIVIKQILNIIIALKIIMKKNKIIKINFFCGQFKKL